MNENSVTTWVVASTPSLQQISRSGFPARFPAHPSPLAHIHTSFVSFILSGTMNHFRLTRSPWKSYMDLDRKLRYVICTTGFATSLRYLVLLKGFFWRDSRCRFAPLVVADLHHVQSQIFITCSRRFASLVAEDLHHFIEKQDPYPDPHQIEKSCSGPSSK